MNITFLGHSCFLFKHNGKVILVDPFISGNPLASEINVEEIPADYIILTHGHQDHVLDAERILERTGAKVISSFEIVSWYGEKGFDGHGMNTGGCFEFEFGKVRAVNAVHSSMLPDGSYGANPLGFVIENDSSTFYIAGDTALTMDMKLIPLLCPPLDFAILPIGGNFTMDYKDAVHAANFIECNKIIGCHFDTFDVIKIDHKEAENYFKENNIEAYIPNVGESLDL
ncbi:metal-dependent hydrolase [Membranihabitans maritimus]|uniref:metal-dependent hydrolase n=1 Tax=Membranihabitans maritimus TaxID=2904244 RepID=UPI001F271C44|nr:metal-dependent hydrolase [Membranihabitans maritimus]